MRAGALVWIVVATSACGRHLFDPLPDGADGTGDDAPQFDAASCGHTFCDDFDRPGPAGAGWDTTEVLAGGTFALTSATSVSAPTSFQAALTAVGDGAFLLKQLPLATTKVTVSLAFSYASAMPGTAEIDLVRLRWDTLRPGCASFGYFLVRDGTMPFNLQETYNGGGCGDAAANVNHYFTDLDNTGFHTVTMEITFGGVGVAHVRLVLDGIPSDFVPPNAIDPSTLTLRIGGFAARNISADWDLRYDDVLVDVN